MLNFGYEGYHDFKIKPSEVTHSVFRGGGPTPYNGLCGEALSKRGTFFRLQVYQRVGILLVEVLKKVGKSVIVVFEDLKGLTDAFYDCEKDNKT